MRIHAIFRVALPLFSSAAVSMAVECHCWIVGGVRNGQPFSVFSATDVTNLVEGANRIFRQAAMAITVGSISVTNDNRLAELDASNVSAYRELCSITNNTGGLEMYFVNRVDGATAFWTKWGIVVGPSATSVGLAHEIGHACGFEDIFENHLDSILYVQGPPSKDRMPFDWGMYPPGLRQADLIERLLMYGNQSDAKIKIPLGDVYGLWYTNVLDQAGLPVRVWQLSGAPVGLFPHGNRFPTSE